MMEVFALVVALMVTPVVCTLILCGALNDVASAIRIAIPRNIKFEHGEHLVRVVADKPEQESTHA